MPAYDYRCAKCGETFEVWQSMSEDPLTKHPGCGGKVARVFAPVGVAFKGSGFYKTDSRAADGGSNGSGSSEPAAASSSGSSDSSD